MTRHGGLLAVMVVTLGGLMGCGCEPTVPKNQFDELSTAYDQCMQQNDQLVQDNQRLRTQVSDLQAQIGSQEAPRDELADLRQAVGDEGTVKMVNGIPAVVLDTDVLFASGKATLNNSAKAALRRVASMVRTKYPTAEVGVAGHTDSQPIVHSKKQFKTNWELSAARALNVVHFLVDSGIDPNRVHAEAYGEHRPVVSDTGKRGEKRNRRVEILLMGIR